MAKASMSKLDALHDAIATYYTSLIEAGGDEDERLTSGELAAINAFLKNNNITADVTESNPMQNLSLKIRDLVKNDV